MTPDHTTFDKLIRAQGENAGLRKVNAELVETLKEAKAYIWRHTISGDQLLAMDLKIEAAIERARRAT